jgi:methylenetetrahydrofolate dehydrogenase (NADP+)/methenyltetrahydrofolate cyclohydrolase
MNTPTILKGKPVADDVLCRCLDMIAEHKLTPHLCMILIGCDPASEYYVSNVEKQAKKYNVLLTVKKYDDISQGDLLSELSSLNHDDSVHGIMIQKPLPKHISPDVIDQSIAPQKDIDGFHPLNAGLMLHEKDCFLPCTALAILQILDHYEISAEGKHIVVVGRSNVVGKPVANLLLYKQKNRNATVTICHSRTPSLSNFTRLADILITAVGKPLLIKKDMIADGVVIIDAGINEIASPEGKSIYVGDVDYQDCFEKTSAVTPVPGGVGSVTTAILFRQLCLAAKFMLSK